MDTQQEYDLQLYGADFWALEESRANASEPPQVPKDYPMSEHNNLDAVPVPTEPHTISPPNGVKAGSGEAQEGTQPVAESPYSCDGIQSTLQVLFLRRYNDRHSVFQFHLTHSGLDQLWRDNLTLTATNYAYVISSINPEPLGQSPEGSTDNTNGDKHKMSTRKNTSENHPCAMGSIGTSHPPRVRKRADLLAAATELIASIIRDLENMHASDLTQFEDALLFRARMWMAQAEGRAK